MKCDNPRGGRNASRDHVALGLLTAALVVCVAGPWLAAAADASRPDGRAKDTASSTERSGQNTAAVAAREAAFSEGDRLFVLKVLPVLKAKCFGCHGDDPKDVKGAFDVRSRAGLLRGGESGEPAIVPGKPEESPLYLAVRWDGLEMPPKENDRLTDEQIAAIRRWIELGAPWPDESVQRAIQQRAWTVASSADGVLVKTSGGLSDEWTYRRYRPEDLWAWQPVKKPPVPVPAGRSAEGLHPVDAFIDAKLAEAGLPAAPEADPRTLIRRASFDLIGLPPKPEEVEAFVAAYQRDPEAAWVELIDRLLASPHYGERWAQHWLDVVRYADTGGYSNDYERSNAWRYRDYVIRAFNEDKPYDQFVVEQLAGDELADLSVRKRLNADWRKVHEVRMKGAYTPQEAEWIVATGFLRMGPWDSAMVKAEEARQIYRDDLVNIIGQTFLSMTLRCTKCHDHKFDPIPTRDYYRIYAALATTQMAERPVPFLPSESRDGFEEGRAFVQRMLDFAVAEKNRLVAKREAAARKWFEERGKPYVPYEKRKDLPDEEKPPRHVGLNYIEEGQLKVREQDEWIWNRRLERYQPMAQAVYNGPDDPYSWPGARRLRIRRQYDPNWRPETHIFLGGSLHAKGPKVTPGVLSAAGVPVPGAPPEDPWALPDGLEGRRLALAKWIVDPRNPLTARSIVNRIWQYHFGYGIARDANNFGAKGPKPTHPELLDWLAADFVEHGWRIKRMHRLIMTSRAYRRASTHPQMEVVRQKDPDNKLLSYFSPRRLTAEEIRDAMLFVTGELNPAVGGLPVMPEINMEVALQPRMIQFSLAPAYQPSRTPEQRNRRTIYAYRVRGLPDPFLEVFNQPNPNDSCAMRDTAAVVPQVFTLLNSDMVNDRAIAFALRLKAFAAEPREQVIQGFRLAFGRMPDEEELQRMVKYIEDMRRYHSRVQPRPVVYPTKITRSLVEEFSGKAFEYEEILPVFENYVPDVKAADVDAQTRALADFCLLLFNANEFMFVY
ncbi:MAG: DUF1553 domain-containing protein [Planctomycetota bacterium]|nr:MAG: DUF1553 domain-containing protein [Planctomycetota bacterium]